MQDFFSINDVYSQYITSEAPTGDLVKVAEVLATEVITPENFPQMQTRVLLSNKASFRNSITDLILYYARIVVRDHMITSEEKENLHLLKMLFEVEEGEFYTRQKSQLSNILSQQALWIIQDRQIERSEDLYQVDLQRIFGLSYDQFVELTQAAVITFLEMLPEHEVRARSEDIQQIRVVFLIKADTWPG